MLTSYCNSIFYQLSLGNTENVFDEITIWVSGVVRQLAQHHLLPLQLQQYKVLVAFPWSKTFQLSNSANKLPFNLL